MRPHRFARAALPLALAFAPAAPAAADSGDGVDLAPGNALLANGLADAAPDARGTSWLRPGQRRSPAGHLYGCPLEPPTVEELGEWIYDGRMQLGGVVVNGDEDNALWNRYVRWDSGLVLGLLEIALRRPADGSYAELRASRLGSDDGFIEAAFGRAGSYKVQALLREMPNVVSDSARPIWNGVGTNDLRLLPSLAPGASDSAAVAAAVDGVAPQRLQVVRSRTGLGLDAYLTPRWIARAAVSEERRSGARPFGGAFFYNFLFPGNAGVLETVRPVEDATVNLAAGIRYAGDRWRMDFAYDGSFYRDRYRRLRFESPFALTPTRPGTTSAPIYQGQFALEPDNDYHNLRATFMRRLPWNGELGVSAAAGRMRQDDDLIAPIDCAGTFGVDSDGSGVPGPANPFLHACADWNTPAALSRASADLRIDTYAFDTHVSVQPLPALSLRGKLDFRREDYRNAYLAYNPLTGDYGYITENGAQASIQPGALGTWNPLTAPSAITRVRSLPLDRQDYGAELGADWQLAERRSLSLTLSTRRDEPTNRERSRVTDDSVKLAYVDRHVEGLTLRASFAVIDRDGDDYVSDPYWFAYSVSLPGFVAPAGGVPAFTVDALRKYDLADRREHKANLSATVALGDTASLSAGLQGDWNDYDAVIGRQVYDRSGATVQWEWQPSPQTRASIHYGADRARLRMANVADVVFGPDGSLGGPDYPLNGRWWAYDKQRNRNAGASIEQGFGPVRLDLNWNLVDARGLTSYRFASPVALAYFADGLTGGDSGEFPAMRYRVDSLSLGASIALTPRVALRVFDLFERGRIDDWHYLGLDTGRVIDHRVYSDGGPSGYTTNLIGVLLDLRL
ncbi:MtrB/PioB family outer membrane beta-barrel protein [Tahibacter caeni]|uniref:MtrB/PioB family outer membrane beta-barrel protein n=1 Tax=Tahibacter caeni TaxID=1453545 RepID=UPI002148BAEF|nr:MtrB/PioB family outer membrane beta-barrel protein [Tahibacter caeni]